MSIFITLFLALNPHSVLAEHQNFRACEQEKWKEWETCAYAGAGAKLKKCSEEEGRIAAIARAHAVGDVSLRAIEAKRKLAVKECAAAYDSEIIECNRARNAAVDACYQKHADTY